MARKSKNTLAYEAVLAFFGGTSKTAAALGISRQAVDNWGKRGISADYIDRISKLTGMTRAQIRPIPGRARGSGAGGRPRKAK